MLTLCTYNVTNRSTAATGPPQIERALKIDLVSVLDVAYFILFSTSAGHNRPSYQRVNDVVRRSWRGERTNRGILILTLGEASQFLMLVFHPDSFRWACARSQEETCAGSQAWPWRGLSISHASWGFLLSVGPALGHRKKPATQSGSLLRLIILPN